MPAENVHDPNGRTREHEDHQDIDEQIHALRAAGLVDPDADSNHPCRFGVHPGVIRKPDLLDRLAVEHGFQQNRFSPLHGLPAEFPVLRMDEGIVERVVGVGLDPSIQRLNGDIGQFGQLLLHFFQQKAGMVFAGKADAADGFAENGANGAREPIFFVLLQAEEPIGGKQGDDQHDQQHDKAKSHGPLFIDLQQDGLGVPGHILISEN